MWMVTRCKQTKENRESQRKIPTPSSILTYSTVPTQSHWIAQRLTTDESINHTTGRPRPRDATTHTAPPSSRLFSPPTQPATPQLPAPTQLIISLLGRGPAGGSFINNRLRPFAFLPSPGRSTGQPNKNTPRRPDAARSVFLPPRSLPSKSKPACLASRRLVLSVCHPPGIALSLALTASEP
jgi:hypothetical protein